MKLWRALYLDGHWGEWRTWESLLELITNGRVWRRRGGPALMIPSRVECQDASACWHEADDYVTPRSETYS